MPIQHSMGEGEAELKELYAELKKLYGEWNHEIHNLKNPVLPELLEILCGELDQDTFLDWLDELGSQDSVSAHAAQALKEAYKHMHILMDFYTEHMQDNIAVEEAKGASEAMLYTDVTILDTIKSLTRLHDALGEAYTTLYGPPSTGSPEDLKAIGILTRDLRKQASAALGVLYKLTNKLADISDRLLEKDPKNEILQNQNQQFRKYAIPYVSPFPREIANLPPYNPTIHAAVTDQISQIFGHDAKNAAFRRFRIEGGSISGQPLDQYLKETKVDEFQLNAIRHAIVNALSNSKRFIKKFNDERSLLESKKLPHDKYVETVIKVVDDKLQLIFIDNALSHSGGISEHVLTKLNHGEMVSEGGNGFGLARTRGEVFQQLKGTMEAKNITDSKGTLGCTEIIWSFSIDQLKPIRSAPGDAAKDLEISELKIIDRDKPGLVIFMVEDGEGNMRGLKNLAQKLAIEPYTEAPEGREPILSMTNIQVITARTYAEGEAAIRALASAPAKSVLAFIDNGLDPGRYGRDLLIELDKVCTGRVRHLYCLTATPKKPNDAKEDECYGLIVKPITRPIFSEKVKAAALETFPDKKDAILNIPLIPLATPARKGTSKRPGVRSLASSRVPLPRALKIPGADETPGADAKPRLRVMVGQNPPTTPFSPFSPPSSSSVQSIMSSSRSSGNSQSSSLTSSSSFLLSPSSPQSSSSSNFSSHQASQSPIPSSSSSEAEHLVQRQEELVRVAVPKPVVSAQPADPTKKRRLSGPEPVVVGVHSTLFGSSSSPPSPEDKKPSKSSEPSKGPSSS